MNGLFFIFGNFSNAFDSPTLVLDISIASATVFHTTFIWSAGNHSLVRVVLYSSTGAANSPVDASIHLVSNCSGYGSILPVSYKSKFCKAL
ncbi:MAG: hypothetical protein Q8S84_02880 [bacterium]|nr:hypothetical protein [bacterium]MDP3380479.1 hypothetical protein [bacterium]